MYDKSMRTMQLELPTGAEFSPGGDQMRGRCHTSPTLHTAVNIVPLKPCHTCIGIQLRCQYMYDMSMRIVRWENNLKPLKPCYICVGIGLPCQCMYDKSMRISRWELLTRVAFGLVEDPVEKVLSYKIPLGRQ
jgi:hypothetical protein